MPIRKIPQLLIKHYLLRYSLPNRMARYRALSRWKWLKASLDEIKDEVFPPQESPNFSNDSASSGLPISKGIQPEHPYYSLRYRCTTDNPLSCPNALIGTSKNSRTSICSLCKFPAVLPEDTKIIGRRGSYRITHYQGRRGIGRLYAGVQIGSEQPVAIKEYLLPQRYFPTLDERRQRQGSFLSVAGLNLADGRSQDLRVITPIEAIANDQEERCYLVTHPHNTSPSLNFLLTQRPAFSSSEVRIVLDQVLQTLILLHQQKFSLPAGEVQVGLTHSNLQLESLLQVVQGQHFYIYLTDLLLWEQTFNPAQVETRMGSVSDGLLQEGSFHQESVQKDLVDLGTLAFYLLTGRTTNTTGLRLDPRFDYQWPPVYPPLKQFILQLIQPDDLQSSAFASAEEARKALLRIPPEPIQVPTAIEVVPEKIRPRRRFSRYLALFIAALLIAVLGGLAWVLLRQAAVTNANDAPPVCCFAEVGAVPTGRFTHVSITGDAWSRFLQHRFSNQSQTDSTVLQALSEAQATLTLTHQPAVSVEAAIEQLRSGQLDFAVLPVDADLPNDLGAETIAYDGLAVFVAFNYKGRSRGLPDALSGQITLQELRQLYTQNLRDWDNLRRAKLNDELLVNLYLPEDRSALYLFEQKVLQSNRAIAQFRSLQSPLQTLPTLEMLRSIIRDFEIHGIGGIGFAPLSTVFGQCSIYPLAIQAPRQAPKQPLVLETGQPISPDTDLCDRKGSYQPEGDLFRTGVYPLAYPISVVYLRDNRRPPVGLKFVELMRTTEGQALLSQAGFIPVRPAP